MPETARPLQWPEESKAARDLLTRSRDASRAALPVREFRFSGNTVFSQKVLAPVTAPWLGRQGTPDVLKKAADAVTRFYTDAGYPNAAVLASQEAETGVVRLAVSESNLTFIQVSGNVSLSPSYITRRLGYKAGERPAPLNVQELERRLALLRADPRVEDVEVKTGKGTREGESALFVKVREKRPYSLSFDLSNHKPPSVGSCLARVQGKHLSVLGMGDTLEARFGLSTGSKEYMASYTAPLGAGGATLGMDVAREETAIVQPPLDILDIQSKSTAAGMTARLPLSRSPVQEFSIGLRGGKTWGKTRLLGEPYSFAPNVDYGKSTINALGVLGEWSRRDAERVVSFQSSLMLGEVERRRRADERYLAFLPRFWWMERVESLGSVLIFRAGAQVCDNDLPPAEKFVIGGDSTVRGYRENQLTTDNGVTASVEWRWAVGRLRFPEMEGRQGPGLVQLAFFMDFGQGWNHSGADPVPESIYSAGTGVVWDITEGVGFRLYWGKGFRDVDEPPDYDIQDEGVSCQFRVEAF